MFLRALDQLAFRNLRTRRLEFSAGVTAVVGRNGAGKSNLLAAAYLGCNANVVSGTLGELIAHGHDEGFVAAEIEHGEGLSRVTVGLSPGRKSVKLDGQAARSFDVAKVSAAVLITPEDSELVHGSPSSRRAYLDGVLTKLSTRYAVVAREYGRVLEQRNALLRNDPRDPSLPAWSERFIELGSEIDSLRQRVIDRVCPLAAEIYREVAGSGQLEVRLIRNRDGASLGDALAASRSEEVARGTTVVGPHRDDLALELGRTSLRSFGSRGEARTTALALRVAEYRLLSERHGEAPVLLIDDFSAELDESRRGYLLDLTATIPQALVTGTETPPRYDRLIEIVDGTTNEVVAAHA